MIIEIYNVIFLTPGEVLLHTACNTSHNLIAKFSLFFDNKYEFDPDFNKNSREWRFVQRMRRITAYGNLS